MSITGGKEGRVLNPEAANFLEKAKQLRGTSDVAESLEDLTTEEFLATALDRKYATKGHDPYGSNGIIQHIRNYGETLPNTGNGLGDELLEMPVGQFFQEHLESFDDYIRGKGIKFQPTYQRITEVGKFFNEVTATYPNTIQLPIKKIQLKRDGSIKSVRPKSTPFLKVGKNRQGQRVHRMDKLDMAFDFLEARLNNLETKINTGEDPQTGAKIKDIGALKRERDITQVAQALLAYQVTTGQRGGESLALVVFDDEATDGFDTEGKPVTVDPEAATSNTHYATFRKETDLETGSVRYVVDTPTRVTKTSVDFGGELSPRVGAIIDRQIRRVEEMAEGLKEDPPRSVFAIGKYNKNGKITGIEESYDYTKTTLKNGIPILNSDKAPNRKIIDAIFGPDGMLAIAGISFNSEFVNPTTGEKGAVQNFFYDHDIRRSVLTYARTGRIPEIAERMKAIDPNYDLGADGANALLSYMVGRDDNLPVEKQSYLKKMAHLEMPHLGTFHAALSDMIMEESDSFARLSADAAQDVGYNPAKTSIKFRKPIEKKVPEKNTFSSSDPLSQSSVYKNTAEDNLIDEMFNDLIDDDTKDLDSQQTRVYKEKQKNSGQDAANKYKDSITDKSSPLLGDNKGPKFDPTVDFMGLNTASQMVQQQVGEIASDFKAGKTLSAVGKSLPILGPVIGGGLAAYYYSKPLEDYIVEGDETKEELAAARRSRALAELGSGFSPIPEPAALNLLNLLPGEQNLNIMSAAEAVAPTGEEAKAREQSGSYIFSEPKKEISSPEDNTNSDDIYTQMRNLMGGEIST